MELLDSFLAFALTLAALATVVTVIMEIFIRVLRLKAGNQVALVDELVTRCISSELVAKDLEAIREQVLNNPFARRTSQSLWGHLADIVSWLPSKLLPNWTRNGRYYEDISLEHFLRRVLEVPVLETVLGNEFAETIEDKLERASRRYDEYRSALADQFKRDAQFWSVAVGLLFAVAFNIDGFRILEVYLRDPAVREEAIRVLQPAQQGEEAADKAAPDAAPAAAPPAEADAAEGGEETGQAAAGAAAEPKNAEVEALQTEVQRLRDQTSLLWGLNLPIGWSYYPFCQPVEVSGKEPTVVDPLCPPKDGKDQKDEKAEKAEKSESNHFLAWLLRVLGSGLLIGLGAPFWYDVARRLAEVRSAFGGKGTASERHRGKDPARADSWDRKQLIRSIVRDFQKALSPDTQPPAPEDSSASGTTPPDAAPGGPSTA